MHSINGLINIPLRSKKAGRNSLVDQVQEIYDANGVKKRDKVDIVRKGVEAYLHFLQNQSSQKLIQLRTKQAELPMKNYENEICEAVAQSSQVESIYLLTGDP